MKRSSVLSRVFFRRAAVKALVPDLKLVLVVLTVGCESHVGVYRPAGLGEDTGLDPSALAGALADLERHNHILPDTGTGEIFVTAFFRDNSFLTAARRGQARDDFAQIESSKLRLAVLNAIDQNPSCGLKSVDFSHHQENQPLASQGEGKVKGEGKGEAAAPRAHARGTADAAASDPEAKRRHPRRTVNGIECWYASDDAPADAIEASANPEQIAAAVAAIKQQLNGAGKKTSPVPALVLAVLERHQRERETDERLAREQQDAKLKQMQCAEKTAAAESFLTSLDAKDRADIEHQFREWLITKKNDQVLCALGRTGIDGSRIVFSQFLEFLSTLHPQPEEAAA